MLNVSQCIEMSKYLLCAGLSPTEEYLTIPTLVQNRLVETIINRVLSNNSFISKNPVYIRNQDNLPYEWLKDTLSIKKSASSWSESYHCYSYDLDFQCINSPDLSLEIALISTILATGFTSLDELWENGLMDQLEYYEEEIQMGLESIISENDSDMDISELKEFWEYSLNCIIDDIHSAINNKDTECEYLKCILSDVTQLLFKRSVNPQLIFENLDLFMAILYCYDGSSMEIYTLSNTEIPKYLQIQNQIPESEEKKALDKALVALEEPINFGYNMTEPIIIKDTDFFSVTYVLGGNGAEYVSAEHLNPFWRLSTNIIDTLLPIVMDQYNNL